MPKKDKIYIEHSYPNLILCEGIDAFYFMLWFLDYIKKIEIKFSSFKVYDFGGISQLKNYISLLTKLNGFEEIVKSITIIRDAETNASGACDSIKNSLQSLGFAVPTAPCTPMQDIQSKYPDIKTGFLLFPTCSETVENGTLEDLCLNIIKGEDAQSILDTVDNALKLYKHTFSCPHKNRLHTFFSFTNEYVSLKIGEAAKCGAFSYDKPEIKNLKKFLAQMV